MKTPTLNTKRLIIRPLTVDDASIAYKNWTSDSEVVIYLRWNIHDSVEITKEWLMAEAENSSSSNYLWGIVLNETNVLIGSISLNYNDVDSGYELGYCIMKKEWNKGYVSEAARCVIDFLFSAPYIKHVYCMHALDNIGSKKIIQKLNFQYLCDTTYRSFDNKRTFNAKKYILYNKNE